MRNVWIWVSAALGVVCIGLLVWALSLKSDRDDAQQQVTQLQAQVDQAAQAAQGGGDVRKALKTAYDSLAQQIGATQQGVDANQQAIETAKTNVEQAKQDAQAAAQKAKDSASSAA